MKLYDLGFAFILTLTLAASVVHYDKSCKDEGLSVKACAEKLFEGGSVDYDALNG